MPFFFSFLDKQETAIRVYKGVFINLAVIHANASYLVAMSVLTHAFGPVHLAQRRAASANKNVVIPVENLAALKKNAHITNTTNVTMSQARDKSARNVVKNSFPAVTSVLESVETFVHGYVTFATLKSSETVSKMLCS